jgi:hypothetical protein
MFISIFYICRATSCSSSEESIISIQHLICVTLCRWPSSMQVGKELLNSCKWPTWRKILFSICLFQFSTCFEQPRAHHQENQLYQYNIWYVSLWPSIMQVWKFLPDLHTRRSPTQSDTYQMLYWYNWFSWWWARGCSKHVENWNKHIEKGIVRKVGHLQEWQGVVNMAVNLCITWKVKNLLTSCAIISYWKKINTLLGGFNSYKALHLYNCTHKCY